MKCPKCGYLGFDDAERCRNCGYDFSLSHPPAIPDLTIRRDRGDEINPLDDLALVDGAIPSSGRESSAGVTPELPLFGPALTDDQPLITRASAPRAPLSVRRATPEVPRLRGDLRPTTPMLDLAPADLEDEPAAVTPAARARGVDWTSYRDSGAVPPASLATRFVAAAIDLVLLAIVNVVVVYLTIQICGLTLDDLQILPKVPLIAFLVVLDGGYFVAFTAGGQTLGKMATGIRVVPVGSRGSLDLPHAIVRTVVWVVLAIPIGLGLLTALFTRDRRGLHDRFAGSRVVRAPA